MSGAIWLRRGSLVRWLIDTVDSTGADGVFLPELVEAGAVLRDERGRCASAKTVDNTIGDLCAFGVFRKARQGRNDVFVRMTVLGMGWSRGLTLPGLDDRKGLQEVGSELLGLDVAPLVDGEVVPPDDVCVRCSHPARLHLSSGGCGACPCRRLVVL